MKSNEEDKGGRESTKAKWYHIRLGRDFGGGWWLVLGLGLGKDEDGHRG